MAMNSLPDFLIVGGQKCGTTTLHNLLKDHPDVNMSSRKEVNYFTLDHKYQKGLSFYAQHWAEKPGAKIVGEASPGYMVYPGVAEKIRKDLGRIKIVVILRDPIKRAVSQYWDNRRHLSENETFEEIYKHYLMAEYKPESKGYFSRGVYIQYIEKYWSLFGKGQVHVMTLEDLVNNPSRNLSRLYAFLDIGRNNDLMKLKASNSSMIWDNLIYRYLLDHPHITGYLPKRGKSIFFFGKQIPYSYPQPSNEIIARLKDLSA